MRRLGISVALAVVLAAMPSCSSTFHAKSCTTDDDCGGTLVCSSVAEGQSACVAAETAPLRIGMSGPVTGPSQELGIEMKKGLLLAFDEQNAAGGIRGRSIELEFRDDEYQPTSAEAAARDLLDVAPETAPARCPTTTMAIADQPVAESALLRGPNAVIGLVGSIGTPTMVRTAPIAVETGSLFFGAFTGSTKVLRDGTPGPCAKYIFNVRASYAQEARATLEYFMKLRVPDSRHLMSFDQADTFGQSGYDGLVAAYTALEQTAPSPPIPRFRYTRDDESSVPAQIAAATRYLGQLLASDEEPHVVGVLMTDTYGPATAFIRGLRDWQYAKDAEQAATDKASRLTLLFSNLSFVGPNTLAERLKDAGTVTTPSGTTKPYSDGVFVSQVVPNYESDDSDAVRQYRKLLDASGQSPSFTSLEGYLTGRVFVAGLSQHVGPFTPDALVATFERMPPQNLGLGASSRFTAGDHNYSKSVFGTGVTADGGFTNLYFWSAGSAIQLFE
jgi:ABC-type branched-subunit amino acid transport system substrate-binding protein